MSNLNIIDQLFEDAYPDRKVVKNESSFFAKLILFLAFIGGATTIIVTWKLVSMLCS